MEPTAKSKHKPVNIAVKPDEPEMKYGWIAPDGRFFGCDYGGHSSLAGKICGKVQDVSDPERHLEELGWAKVLSGNWHRTQYTIGMGANKKLTDSQMRTIQDKGLEHAYGVSGLL